MSIGDHTAKSTKSQFNKKGSSFHLTPKSTKTNKSFGNGYENAGSS